MSKISGGALAQQPDDIEGSSSNVVATQFARMGEHSFRQIVQSLPSALYTTDAEGRITYFNDAAALLWGRRPTLNEERWCGAWRLYDADGQPMDHADCPMAATIRTGRPVSSVEAIGERPDGSRYWFVPHPTPIFDAAGRLVRAVNVLVDVTARKQAEESDQRLAAIIASSDDAIVGKRLDGTITSWNAGAERLFGYASEDILGRSILTLIPDDRRQEETDIIERINRGERVEHFETIRLHKSGRPLDISLTVSPIRDSRGRVVGASKIARDITEQKRAAAELRKQAFRLETLNRVSRIISRDLDLDRVVQAVTDLGTELSGAKFGAFFYNVKDSGGESYTLYTLSGAPREAFEKFGMPRNTEIFAPTFAGSGIVRSDDIRKDPRYARNAPHHGMPQGHLPVVSYLAVPVISSSGEVIGGLFFGHDEPGRFGPETETLIASIAGQAAVAMDNSRLHREAQAEIAQRRQAEEAKEILLHEIKHRVKNSLATIQAIASQTFKRAPVEERTAFIERLHALSRAHDLLTQAETESVDLPNVVARALSPFRLSDDGRISICGPPAQVEHNRALLLSIVLHELGTNAVKYGALSEPGGAVAIEWSIESGLLSLRWDERGGPEPDPQGHRGFGSRLIESAIEGEGGTVSFDFLPAGLSFAMSLPLAA